MIRSLVGAELLTNQFVEYFPQLLVKFNAPAATSLIENVMAPIQNLNKSKRKSKIIYLRFFTKRKSYNT